jgi:hypothetical protein
MLLALVAYCTWFTTVLHLIDRRQIYLRLNDAKKTVETEEDNSVAATSTSVTVATTGGTGADEGNDEHQQQKPPAKRGRGRPKGSTNKTTAKTKVDKGKEKADGEQKDEQEKQEKQEEKPADKEASTESVSCVVVAAESVEKAEGEKGKKEEQEYFYEPDYVDINALWLAIREHWQRFVAGSPINDHCAVLSDDCYPRDCPSISDPISNELVLMTLGTHVCSVAQDVPPSIIN